jgi:hypothetical protein
MVNQLIIGRKHQALICGKFYCIKVVKIIGIFAAVLTQDHYKVPRSFVRFVATFHVIYISRVENSI